MEFENLHDLYYIWLSSVLNPGNSSAKILLEYFDSIEDLFGADAQTYMYAGISEKDAKTRTLRLQTSISRTAARTT